MTTEGEVYIAIVYVLNSVLWFVAGQISGSRRLVKKLEESNKLHKVKINRLFGPLVPGFAKKDDRLDKHCQYGVYDSQCVRYPHCPCGWNNQRAEEQHQERRKRDG